LKLSGEGEKVRTVKVFPDPDDAECSVDVESLTSAEYRQILDKAGYVPDSEKHGGVGKLYKAAVMEARRRIKSWQGMSDGKGEPLECNQFGIDKLHSSFVEIDGQKKTVWMHIRDLAEEEIEGQEKNSQSS